MSHNILVLLMLLMLMESNDNRLATLTWQQLDNNFSQFAFFLENTKTIFFVACLSNFFVKAKHLKKENNTNLVELIYANLCENKSHVCPGF